jgi:glycosyltransferase involved in cell wall biosynthesis/GT2 family glycosyltransferase
VRILWVHNRPTHYTARLFQLVGERLTAEFLFFSRGAERYWLKEHGVQPCNFAHHNLSGIQVFGTRITPSLLPHLIHKNYDAVVQCIDGKFALPLTYLIARLRKKPLVLYTGIWMRVDTVLHRLTFPIIRHIYRNAGALVVYGEHVSTYLIAEGVSPERIFIEPHAVDNTLYQRPVGQKEKDDLRHALDLPPETKLVLYLGRLEPEKGLQHLLRAFASIGDRQTALILAGIGSEERALKDLASSLGIAGRVRWPGYVPTTDTLPYYASAAVFVLPSVTTRRDKETWGLVVNEAFNQALPVIATDAVGAAAGGLIEDGINGLIVPEADHQALARALSTVLSNETLRASMGDAALRRIAYWTQERAAEAVERAVRFATGEVEPSPLKLFVVIPVHNRIAFTRACLRALALQTAAGFETIVIDDGSTDGTAPMIRAEFPAVELLSGDGTLWWSGATNLGITRSLDRGATHILTLNDDTKPPPGFMERLLDSAALLPHALLGAYATDALTGHPVYGGEKILWATASFRGLLPRETGGQRIETTHAPGRGLVIPAAVIRRIGLFDAAHFPQLAADYDFTHRARRAGFRIYCDRSLVLPIYPQSSGDASYRRNKAWRNYRRHLFDIKGGGNLRVFFWYALRNCPWPLLPLALSIGFARRLGGYLLEWLIESISLRKKCLREPRV